MWWMKKSGDERLVTVLHCSWEHDNVLWLGVHGAKMTFSFHISCQAKGQLLARYLSPQWWRHIIAVDLTHSNSHETADFFLKPPLHAGPCTRVVMPWGSQEVHKIPAPPPHPSVVWMTKEQDIFWTKEYSEGGVSTARDRKHLPLPTKFPSGKQDAPSIHACISVFLAAKSLFMSSKAGEK